MNKLSEKPEVKEKIRDVLYECMVEMPYNKITIKKIADRLGMSRQNFYRYYMSKDDILLDLIDINLDVVYGIVETNFEPSSPNTKLIAESIVVMIPAKKALLHEILSCTSEDIVFTHVSHFIRRLVGRFLRENQQKEIDQNYLDIIISQYAGSVYYLAKAWAQTDGNLEPTKLSHILQVYLDNLFMAIEDPIVSP